MSYLQKNPIYMYIIATQRHKNTVQFKMKCCDLVILPRACGNVGHHWLWGCLPKASGSSIPQFSLKWV